MKSKNLLTKKNAAFLLGILLIVTGSLLIMSCSTNASSQDVAGQKVEKVKAPGIDLNTAAYTGNLAAVEQHIKAGTKLNSKDPMGGATPLLTACVFGKTEVARALINAGADMSIPNNDGATPLHVAAFFCHTDIVKALIAHGADKNALNGQGVTALQSVVGPFNEVKPIYDFLGKQLGALGLTLDYAHIEATRPVIAELLK